jgi:hypothetical protein
MLINDIVKDFQHPAFGIEAKQKMFVLVVGKINLVFKNPVGKGAANIRLVNPVLKSGFAELNITVQHIPILPGIGQEYKRTPKNQYNEGRPYGPFKAGSFIFPVVKPLNPPFLMPIINTGEKCVD